MEMLIRNGLCIEVLERITDKENIIRDEDDNVIYLDDNTRGIYSLTELIEEHRVSMSKIWRNDEYKDYLDDKYKKIIDIMRKYSRGNLIDDLLDDKPNLQSITGLSPLVFAC